MRLGVAFFPEGSTLDGLGTKLQEFEAAGFDTVWMPQIFGWDTLTAIAVAGPLTSRIELATAVVPTYPRHPVMLAAQALTVNAVVGGRLALGIGLSHKIVIDDMFGLSYERPAVHMKDYLSILGPLLRDRVVAYQGSTMRSQVGLQVPPDVPAPPVYIAAMADRMLHLAGSMADGTILWMTGPATVERHIVPLVTKAAADAGRPSPRVVVGLPIQLTTDPAAARAAANDLFSLYGQLPSSRAMLDREGAALPGDIALVGDEMALAEGIRRVREAGATDFEAAPFGDPEDVERTLAYLASRTYE